MNTPQLLAAAALAASLAACAGTAPEAIRAAPPAPDAADSLPQPHNLIVFFNEAEVLYDYQNLNAVALKIPPHKSLDEAEHHFAALPGVLAANRDQSHRLHPVLPMKR